VNLLPGALVGQDGTWSRVRLAAGAEVLADAGGRRLYAGAPVIVAVRPADLRIEQDPGALARAGTVRATVARVERVAGAALIVAAVAGGPPVTVACSPACAPAPGSTVGLAFDPACGRVREDASRAPMRRGPGGPYLVDGAAR
jgi:hypothetical protein